MPEADEYWKQAEAIFHETLRLREPSRTATLTARCGGDTALLEELRALLAACAAEEAHQEDCRHAVEPTEAMRVGPYRLERLLGRGGMGAVYLAQRDDGEFEQQVAIKIIDLPLATAKFRERFRSERQILAGLVHPYIARLLDGGVSAGGEPYLVMEYVEGVSVTSFAAANELTLAQRLELFRKVCTAVQFAHQNLVIHRDLKPDNILVAQDGTPRLIDFGTARILDVPGQISTLDATRAGMQMFTPRFASPEQVLGRPVSTASDIYSLGVLLFLLLTGKPAYELVEFSTEEMVRVICEEVPRAPSAVDAGLDADVDAMVLKALRKEPQERYATVEQFAADVQAYLEHRPVLARRGSARYLAGKFVRRHRLALAAGVVLLVTMLAGVAGVLWQSHLANRERHRAEARSADLRELSNSLLSELDDALQQIPGSTGAQKLLVTRILEHLDRMAKDAQGDKPTTLDLIEAYKRLGNVQGNLYYQNVADTAGATASLNKAVTLAAQLSQLYPRDKEVLRAEAAALEARGETLSDSGDAQASAASLEAAAHEYDRVIELPGVTAEVIFEAAIAYETLGSEAGEDTGLGDPEAAAAAYRRAIALDERALVLKPNYMAVRGGLPLMHLHLANLVLETDPEAALTELETGVRLQAALPESHRAKLQQVRLRALLQRKQATAYCELGRYATAAPLMAQSLATYEKLARADAGNASAQGDLKRVLAPMAACEEYAADPLLADGGSARDGHLRAEESVLARLAETLRRLGELDPQHAAGTLDLASVTVQQGAVRHALREPATTMEATAGALRMTREAARAGRASAGDMGRAVDAELTVQPETLRDVGFAVRCAERGVAMTHAREAAYWLQLARARRMAGDVAGAEEAARAGAGLLPKAGGGGGRSRLEKLLTAELGDAARH